MQNFDARESKAAIFNIDELTLYNTAKEKKFWEGENLSLNIMSIPIGNKIKETSCAKVDRFLRIENGIAEIYLGKDEENLQLAAKVNGHYAAMIPKGEWFGIVNSGLTPLKIYFVQCNN